MADSEWTERQAEGGEEEQRTEGPGRDGRWIGSGPDSDVEIVEARLAVVGARVV